MDETKLVLIALVAVIFLLAVGLVLANRTMSRTIDHTQRFNLACLKHVVAESANQREMMRIESDAAHQELLLRELRAKEAKANRIPPPPATREGEPDLLVNLETGNSVN